MALVKSLGSELRSAWHRARLYADLPTVASILQYRKIRRDYYRELWRDTAVAIGADHRETQHGFIRLTRDGLTTYAQDYLLMLDSHLVLEVMGNKAVTLELLKELGAPVPESCEFSLSDFTAAEKLLSRSGNIVVKPKCGTGGGRGVTTGITNRDKLISSAKFAARSGPQLIAEAQLDQPCFRLLYLDGKLLDAVRRDPPSVIGDGKTSIRNLIKQENKRRTSGSDVIALSPLNIDRDSKNWLLEQDRKLSDIPADAEIVQVKRAINQNNSSQNVNVTSRISEQINLECGKIASALSIRLAGIDLYCHDISGQFEPSNCVVGEVNTTPGLHHHYLISDPGQCRNVACTILDFMFKNEIGTMKLTPVAVKKQVAKRVPKRNNVSLEKETCNV
ncbi:MAG: cyanophycin synthetase [Pseudomonadota bacterium]